jgi:AraC-like DNA-binding protein
MSTESDRYQITVSISVLSQLVRYLAHLKTDIPAVFKAAGADPEILEQPDRQIPIEQYIAIEDQAASATGDPCFGLHMGEFFEPGHWSILGYMMMNCRTLGEAAEKNARYQRIIGNLIGSRLQLGIKKVKIILTVPRHAPTLSRHCFEAVFSSSIRMFRTLTGKPYCPLEVGFSYPAPASPEEYKRVFGCPVLFDQKHTSMTVRMDLAGTPILTPNAQMLERFENYAREYLSELESPARTTQEVIKIILEQLDSRNLSVASVARTMCVSVRTLQGKLKEEGVVFSDLLQQTRVRLAKKYLKENYTVEDITYLLGFTEASVFRKAFKKWLGQTPREFRELASVR